MSRQHRRQRVDLGGFEAIKIGGPGAFADLYYSLMEIRWPAFFAVVSAAFVLINLGFGLLYAALPGAIGNMVAGSVADGFFFSVETLGTVGYGNMAPATRLGHAIAAVEILLGLFFSATMTGLIFARFARPRAAIVFSRVAVVSRVGDRMMLMVRLASLRAQPLADVSAQMSWLERVTLPDGQIFRRLADLPLVRSQNPAFALTWTLVHVIEPGSAMMAALERPERFRLTVTVSGLDTLLASPTLGQHSYGRADIRLDHEFEDIILDEDGLVHLDLSKLHDVRARGAVSETG
ncbi:ion channel [uncultured Sphingomonas sp.]|uniref:ion channel n=1 Tax=uncultured Sphingomonas sp. TaxID=158754 RepID=UPI00260EE3A9|nr:ion channel [uncultured Sphingomonas sp.]